jgi:hypothetical protein
LYAEEVGKMKTQSEKNETHCLDMMVRIRTSLRAAVKEFLTANYDVEGLRQRLRYSDGKVYEITIREVKDESAQ